MRRLVSSALAAGLCTLGLVAPAAAGTVYVALTADSSVQGIRYESVLRVTNTGTAPHFFVVHFIPSFADGTDRAEDAPALIGVPPGHTYVYENLSLGSGQTGMLEITGDDQLVFDASLRATGTLAKGETSRVPVVGSDHLAAAGERIVVQGVLRDSGRLTSFGLINLAKQDNSCQVDLLGADGAKLMATAVLSVKPLAQFFYHDVVAVAGLPTAADARFEVVCSSAAYAFGQVVDLQTGALSPLLPSSSLLSALRPPDQEPQGPVTGPGSGSCGGDYCYELTGTYFVPTAPIPVLRLEVPIPKGKFYDRLDIDMTVVHGGWFPAKPDGFHNFFWLFDGKWSGGTWGYVNARGPGKGIVTSLHYVGIPQGRRSTASLLLEPGATYRLHYTYDAANGVIETTFFDAGGAVVAKMTDVAPVKRLVFGSEAGVQLWFGLEGHFEEVPTFGWQYQNFQLSLTE